MKILLVEDEPSIAASVLKGLTIHSYIVDTVTTGQDAIDMATTEEYDVIILDRMLPDIHGDEVCKQIRSQSVSTPVLMLTAMGTLDNKVTGLESGADDYLVKPFAFSELIARIKTLARRKALVVTNWIEFADLRIHPESYRVTRNDTPIELSRMEYTLLEFLVRHTGQVFTAEQLAERVWPYDADILPNTVQVYIGYLRKKIDKAFPDRPALIKTMRGFGYSIQE